MIEVPTIIFIFLIILFVVLIVKEISEEIFKDEQEDS